MLTDRSFVLTVPAEPDALRPLRAVLEERLPPAAVADEALLVVAGLLVRQAQAWRGGYGPVRVRVTTLGPAVQVEVLRDVEDGDDTGPVCSDAFDHLLRVLVHHTDRFTVTTEPGTFALTARRQVAVLAREAALDLRVAA